MKTMWTKIWITNMHTKKPADLRATFCVNYFGKFSIPCAVISDIFVMNNKTFVMLDVSRHGDGLWSTELGHNVVLWVVSSVY